MSSSDCIELSSGGQMPRIGLGSAFGQGDQCKAALSKALEVGYRSIDTAYVYGNETDIGEALQGAFAEEKVSREDVFVTSKLPAIANRSSDVVRFLEMSLERLKLEFLDLYLIHGPFGLELLNDSGETAFDLETDLEALWKTMEEQVEAGKVKAIGISNFNCSQIERIMKVAKIQPAVNQIELHGYLQQRTLVEKCKEHGIAVAAYSPLGAPYTPEGQSMTPLLMEHPTVGEIATSHEKTCAQVLLRFLHQMDIIILPKSVTPERIVSNFNITDFTLSDEEMESLVSIDKGEEARVYHFTDLFPGCENHKEYPFLERI